MANCITENRRLPAGTAGKVIMKFVVELDSRLAYVQVKKGLGNSAFDEEALQLIRAMPPWTNGTQNGSPMRVSLAF